MPEQAQTLSRFQVTLLHHRYRQAGGEERCVRQIAELVEGSGGRVAMIERASADYAGERAAGAALALVRGGDSRGVVPDGSLEEHVVHAHNVHPTFGWRTLAALRERGAAIVLHLHNYRLFCATGLASRGGEDCVECATHSTWRGVRHNCRESLAEAAPYAIGIGLWQKRLISQADVVVAPCAALPEDLMSHGVIDDGTVVANWVPEREFASRSRSADGTYGLIAARLSSEKGVEIAVRAAAASGVPLKVAGEGPELAALRAQAGRLGAEVTFLGHVESAQMRELRAGAAFALLPSTWREVQPFAAVEALAAGVPVVAADTPALRELTSDELIFRRGDASALAALMRLLVDDREALRRHGESALERARTHHSETGARIRLAEVYETALRRRGQIG
jgi:glycosyltransferase involved in cell wall biosynthesis